MTQPDEVMLQLVMMQVHAVSTLSVCGLNSANMAGEALPPSVRRWLGRCPHLLAAGTGHIAGQPSLELRRRLSAARLDSSTAHSCLLLPAAPNLSL